MDTKTLIRQIYHQAQLLGCCALFKGTEDVDGLIELFLSPQGQEFCMRYHFPNIATIRLFKQYGVERFGIYIDAGQITLENPSRAIFVGRTSATVNCDTNERHEVVLFHGARAMVNASKWAVVFVKAETGCPCIKSQNENALIL